MQRDGSTVRDLSQPANLPQHCASLDGIRPDRDLRYYRLLAQYRQRRKRRKENSCNSHSFPSSPVGTACELPS